MPAIKMKPSSKSVPNVQLGSKMLIKKSGPSVKPSKSRAKKDRKKAKSRRQKKMNLPSRLSRIINYGTNMAQKILAQRNTASTTRHQANELIPGTKIDNALNNGFSSASRLSAHTLQSHQRTFERGLGCTSRCSDEQVTNGESKPIPKGRLIALDCEMVGVGPQGRVSALARCSIVDYDGNILYDSFIKPELDILDYRTPWSGIRECDMKDATPFREAQPRIKDILEGTILLGHSIRFDLEVLKLGHPKNDIRDTSMYRGLSELAGLTLKAGQQPGLKKLTKLLFGHSIQSGEHCSVEDAKATMNLYKLVENQWEEEIISTFPERDFRLSFMDDHFWPDDLGQ